MAPETHPAVPSIAVAVPPEENRFIEVMRRLAASPIGLLSLIITLSMALLAAGARVIVPYDPYAMVRGQELLPPSSFYWMGTDEYGRDILSRVILGSRISLGVGVVVVILGGTAGIAAGLATGYWEGWVDTVVMRICDTLLAFPAILLGIVLTTLFQPGVMNAALALAIITFPQFTRIVRACALAEKQREYTLAARVMGASNRRIVLRHILPNVTAPVVVHMSLAMAFAALLEAGLSFLGLGAQPPEPAWGSMLSTSRPFLRDAPWYAIAPGAALTLLVLGLNFLADGLRSAFDPRGARATKRRPVR